MVQQNLDFLKEKDPEIAEAIGLELGRQRRNIELIASENIVSEAVLSAMGSVLTNKYAEGYPGKRYYGGCECVDVAENIARERACRMQALRHNIAIYSAHTSMDSYLHGVSGRIAEKLGIQDYRILIPSASHVGAGLGVIGDMAEPMEAEAFVEHVARVFAAPNTALRWVKGEDKRISTVAICGGAGAEFLEQAIAQGADAFVSADFKYHELQNAYQRITVVDMDHWVSEHFTREIFEQLLSPYISTRIARTDESPIKYHAFNL